MEVIRILIIIIILGTSMLSRAQVTLTEEQEEKIKKLVERDVPGNAPGVAFGLISEGEVIYSHCAGFAHLDSVIKINNTTRFNIASNAKQFTGLAILLLEEEGKLSLSDDIRGFFPELFPEIKDKIEIGHLLTHTSGIRDFYDLLALQNITWWDITMNNQEVLQLLAHQRDLNFRPGSEHLYSNSNYVILAEIIAKVTKTSFSNYMNHIFQRLGMHNTRFESNYKVIDGILAKPYFNFNTWTSFDWVWNVVGDGNLFTTLEDQLLFEKILQTKGKTLSHYLINKSQKRIFEDFDYGFGLEFSTFNELPLIYHHGATGAWKSNLMRFPTLKLSLITMSNSGKTDVIDQNQQIAAILLHSEGSKAAQFLTAPVHEGSFIEKEEIPGVYQNQAGSTIQLVERDGAVFLKRPGRNDIQIVREANNIFHQSNDADFKQEFRKGSDGTLTITCYYPTHAPFTLKKVEADFQNFEAESITGRYISDETGTSVNVTFSEGRDYLITIGDYKTNGLLITREKMIVDFYTFNFGKGKMILDGDRIKNVVFEKISEEEL